MSQQTHPEEERRRRELIDKTVAMGKRVFGGSILSDESIHALGRLAAKKRRKIEPLDLKKWTVRGPMTDPKIGDATLRRIKDERMNSLGNQDRRVRQPYRRVVQDEEPVAMPGATPRSRIDWKKMGQQRS